MRRASYSLLWATVLASVALGPAGGALAAGGTTTSAGDQQYLDPLTSSAPSATTPSAPAATAPSSSAARAPASASSTAGASAARHDPTGRTLPYTGFNLWIPVWVGLGLVILGLVLRRLTRRATRPDA